jgi:hypothetical protein
LSDYYSNPIPTLTLPLKGRERIGPPSSRGGNKGSSPFKGEVGRGMG